MIDYSNIGISKAENSKRRYWCKRCNGSFHCQWSDERNSEKIITVNIGLENEFVGRFLSCGHAVNTKDVPFSFGDESHSDRIDRESLNPEELRELNIEKTMEFSKLQSDEQRTNFIEHHIEEYRLHMRAQKKEKYIIQLVEDLEQKRIESMNLDNEAAIEAKRQAEVKFAYLFRKPEKRAEILAKEKVSADKKVVKKQESVDDAIAKLRAFMSKTGLKMGDLK